MQKMKWENNMEFQIGQNIKINDITFRVSAFVENYALAIDVSKGIVEGGYVPVILSMDTSKTKINVVTDENIAKEALHQILKNGQFV